MHFPWQALLFIYAVVPSIKGEISYYKSVNGWKTLQGIEGCIRNGTFSENLDTEVWYGL